MDLWVHNIGQSSYFYVKILSFAKDDDVRFFKYNIYIKAKVVRLMATRLLHNTEWHLSKGFADLLSSYKTQI